MAGCPDAVAYDFFGTTATYRQFAAEIDRCADALAAMGLQQGDRIVSAGDTALGRRRGFERVGGAADGSCEGAAAALAVVHQQRDDLRAQGIVAGALGVEQCFSFLVFECRGPVEEPLQSLPAGCVHDFILRSRMASTTTESRFVHPTLHSERL